MNGIENISSLRDASDVDKIYTIDEMRCFEKDTVVHKYLEGHATSLHSLFSELDKIKKDANAVAKPFLERIERAKGGGTANAASDKIARELALNHEHIRLKKEKGDCDNHIKDATNIFNKLLEEAVTSYFNVCRRDRTRAETLLSVSGVLLLFHFRKKTCPGSMRLAEGEAGDFDSFTEAISNIYDSLGCDRQRSLSTLFGDGLKLQVFESCSNGTLSLTLT
jgi:hypothetical protein